MSLNVFEIQSISVKKTFYSIQKQSWSVNFIFTFFDVICNTLAIILSLSDIMQKRYDNVVCSSNEYLLRGKTKMKYCWFLHSNFGESCYSLQICYNHFEYHWTKIDFSELVCTRMSFEAFVNRRYMRCIR